jgi:CRISPR-associated protein Csm4
MNFTILRLRFITALHIGDGELGDSGYCVPADTLFSALCTEAHKSGGTAAIAALVAAARSGSLLLSDALPYVDDNYYVPKPVLRIRSDDGENNDRKAFKKLKYIPLEMLERYLSGGYSSEDAKNEMIDFKLGASEARTQVNVGGDPYQVGAFMFYENAGLYVLVGYTDEAVLEIFDSLSFSGIGGKRSSGLGRFEIERAAPDDFEALLNLTADGKYMTLSASMACSGELEAAIDGANYVIKRRGGFVASADYSETPRRKRDFYSFAAGSVFASTFSGDVFDVSNGGTHPVWRYAKPLFIDLPGTEVLQ